MFTAPKKLSGGTGIEVSSYNSQIRKGLYFPRLQHLYKLTQKKLRCLLQSITLSSINQNGMINECVPLAKLG